MLRARGGAGVPELKARSFREAATSVTPASELRKARVKFALTFGVVAGALLTLYSFPYGAHGVRESFFEWYLSGYARMTGTILKYPRGGPPDHRAGVAHHRQEL